METNLSSVIDITNEAAKYDASVKEVLADKQILARILKYSVEEFEDMELEAIIESMDEPVVSRMRMEPGQTNLSKVERSAEEDSVPGEGKIYYDIRFAAYIGEEMIKFLINIEAQKSTRKSLLGYHLDNRIIYYLSRMISAQKEVEFTKSNYDDIKSVRSIWICMDANADEDSINRIRFTQESVYGKMMELPNIDKVQGIIVRLRSKGDVETSRNYLIAMLEELLRTENVTDKKKKLEEEYGLVMSVETERRVNVMCNLSEVIMERELKRGRELGIEQGRELGIEQGRELGIEQGREQGREQGIEALIESCQELGVSREMTFLKVMDKYSLKEDAADKYFEKYWK